jgi:dCTP deaminase
MFLSDVDIKKAVDNGEITLSDFDEKRLQPASYDILLGERFLIFDSHTTPYIDPVEKKLPEYREVIIKK